MGSDHGSARTRRAAILLALLAGVLAALWWIRARDGRAPAAAPGAEPPPAARGGEGGASPAGAARGPAPSLGGPTAERLQAALDDYRRAAVYPPWSRPHDEGTAYKLRWNDPVVSDLPFVETGARALMFRFAADRAHVGFGEAITSWIEVFERDRPDARVPARVVQAWVMSNAGAQQGRTVALRYGDDGAHGDPVAGDLRYGNRFVPSEHDELATAQQVRILAEVEVDGERRVITRDFTYAPRPVLEIRRVRDAARDGHLVVTLEVEVFEPGLHTIEANVWTGDGEIPIAYVDTSMTLPRGAATAELVFFGRAFRERGVEGPYLVRDLRGFLRDVDGGENLWWSDGRAHTTEPYPRGAMSDAEWDADEKRDKIQRFESLIDRSRK